MQVNFGLQTAKVVGTPTDGFWSQVHTFFPEDKQKKEKRGDLLAVLVISGAGEGIEAVAAGREVLGRIHEEYYGNLEGSAFERLNLAVEKVGGESENLEIVAGAVLSHVLYLATFGRGKVLLKRDERMGILISGDGGLKTISGFLEENDLLVLGSDRFFSAVGGGVLRAALENGSVDEAIEILAPIILGRKEMSKAAAIVVLIKKQEEEIRPMETTLEISSPELTEKPPKSSPLNKILGINLPFKDFKKPIFVKSERESKKKRLYFLTCLVLLSLFFVSLFLGIRKKTLDQKEVQARKLLKLAEERLNQGKIIAVTNPSQGKVLGEEVVRLTEEAVSLSKKNNEEASVIKGQTQNFLSSLASEALVDEPAVFMDLNLIADGAYGNGFVLAEKELAILDSSKKKIYFLNFEKKSHKVVDLSVEKGNMIAYLVGKAFVLNEEGVWEIELQSSKSSLKIKKDNDWKEIVSLGAFGNNVYLLDKGANSLWRYLGSDGNFSPKANWMIDKTDLSSATSMVINGSIWILQSRSSNSEAKILKFTFGKQETFSLTKMPEGFGEPIKIFTSDESENLYVLDKGKGKVWVINKSGEYNGSYAGEWLKQASDIIAVESIKKIFILSGVKIYEIGTK